MRTIEETLTEQAEIAELDSFDYEVLQHLAIAYKFNNTHVMFYVNEKFGVYDGLKELCGFVYKDIYNNIVLKKLKKFELDYTRDQFKDIPNIFFECLHLSIDTTKELGAECDDENVHLNLKTLLFDDIFINVWMEDHHDMSEQIRHEMTHLYNHYNSVLKGSKYFKELSSSKFYKDIIDRNYDLSMIQKEVRRILYLTLDEERNAFIAQLSGELNKYKKYVETPMDALKILKECSIYKAYKSLYYYINLYKDNKLSQDIIDTIVDEYNYISETQLTANKVFKKLEFLINKSNRKLDNIIGKLCLENLNNASCMAPAWLYIEDRDFDY